MIELTKSDVRHLHKQACFECKWSGIDPYEYGLRCCNAESEHCTENCPECRCEHYDAERKCRDCKYSRYIGSYSFHICQNMKSRHCGEACPKTACECYKSRGNE